MVAVFFNINLLLPKIVFPFPSPIPTPLAATMKLLNHLQISSLALFYITTSAQKVIDLSTSKWTLSSSLYNISVPGSVPSQVHLDLFRGGVIPDPYFGLGDFELRWVSYGNWSYETRLLGV